MIPGEEVLAYPSPCGRKTLYKKARKLSRMYGIRHVELDAFHGARVDADKTAHQILALIKHEPNEVIHLQVCGDGFRAVRHCEVLNGCMRVLKYIPLVQTGFSSLFTL